MNYFAQLIARRQSTTRGRRDGGTNQKRGPPRQPAVVRSVMSQAARNDTQAKRMIEWLYAEGVTPENITRLMNYHFAETYTIERDHRDNNKHVIRRVPEGENYAPNVEVWRQQ